MSTFLILQNLGQIILTNLLNLETVSRTYRSGFFVFFFFDCSNLLFKMNDSTVNGNEIISNIREYFIFYDNIISGAYFTPVSRGIFYGNSAPFFFFLKNIKIRFLIINNRTIFFFYYYYSIYLFFFYRISYIFMCFEYVIRTFKFLFFSQLKT